MPESTLKKQLMEVEEDMTPAKAVVACDINSWLQTHEKENKAQTKFKITKKLYSRPPKTQPIAVSPTLNQLKQVKDQLMKNTFRKSSCKALEQTKPSSGITSRGGSHEKKVNDLMARLPIFHVNEFTIDQSQRKKFQDVNLIPSTRPFIPYDCKNSSRRTSLQKLKIKVRDESFFNFQVKKSIMGQILKQKSTRNSYAGSNLQKNEMIREKRVKEQLLYRQ